jgi:Spy/CpxP family protein refolding chaperone
MKRVGVLAAAVMLLATGACLAQQGATGVRQRSGAEYHIESIDPIVQLTEEQKQRIAAIFDSSLKASQEFMDKNGAKSKAAEKAIADAYASNDAEAQQRAQEEFQAVHEPMRRIIAKRQEDLSKVLTREQEEKLLDHRSTAIIKVMTEGAKLSPDQVKQLKAAYRESVKHPESGENITVAIERVLMPEQKTAIARGRAVQYAKQAFAPAKLTDDQLKKVARICEELVSDPETGPQLYELLFQRVKELLTKEQRAAMEPPAAGGAGR